MVKYITLIFSDTNGKPSKHFRPTGYGGLSHNFSGYLKPLVNIAKKLNRIAVLPPPWISLNNRHNNEKCVPKDLYWDEYFDLNKINNVVSKLMFDYESNGDIITSKSITYYSSNTNLNQMKTNSDIIALVNHNDSKGKLRIYTMLGSPGPITYNISIKYKELVKNIILKLNVTNYASIHIRRTDFLDNKKLAPPNGTRPYTDSHFVTNFIKNKINNKLPIFIFTDEKDETYKMKLIKLLKDYRLIFEKDFYKFLDDSITNNNYSIYVLLCEIANRSLINVGTHGYVRLGKNYHFRLCNQKY